MKVCIDLAVVGRQSLVVAHSSWPISAHTFARKRANFCAVPMRSHSLHFVDCNYVAASAAALAAARRSVRLNCSVVIMVAVRSLAAASAHFCGHCRFAPFWASTEFIAFRLPHIICAFCHRVPRFFHCAPLYFNVSFAAFLLCFAFVAYIKAHFIKICCHCFRLSLFFTFCSFPFVL